MQCTHEEQGKGNKMHVRDQGHREFPFGNSRELRTPKFPAGIPGNFWYSGGNYGEFREFCLISNFYCWLWHFSVWFNRLLSKILNDVFGPTFCVYRVPVYFQILISKITEQRQNFANSDRYTNEDAEIILIGHRPRFCFHRPGMEGVLRKICSKGRQCPGEVCPDGGIVDTTERWSIAAGQSRHVGRMECWWHWYLGRFHDLSLQIACTLLLLTISL